MIDIETAELSVIGSILLTNGRALDDIDLSPSDYRHPSMETLHRTMQHMRSEGTPIDVLTVPEALAKVGEKVDPMLLHRASEATPSASNAEYYAGIVADAATMRRLNQAAERIKQLADGGGDADEIVEAARKVVDQAQSSTRARPVRFLEDTLEDLVAHLESDNPSVPTPWPSLDRIIGGLRPGALYVVGARPSVGKSVVGLQLAKALAAHGSVAFISLEMSATDIGVRLVASDTSTDMGVLTRQQLNDSHWTKIGGWIRGPGKVSIAINDNSGSTLTDIKRFVRSVNRAKPLAGVVVDYLQLMTQPPGDKRPRHEYVADMSRQLKIMAMELNIPVIALSQLNRGSTAREDQRPKISDLRESGAVEQDADVVILLHREIDTDRKYEISMYAAKNRHGPTGATDLAFVGHYARIEDPS